MLKWLAGCSQHKPQTYTPNQNVRCANLVGNYTIYSESAVWAHGGIVRHWLSKHITVDSSLWPISSSAGYWGIKCPMEWLRFPNIAFVADGWITENLPCMFVHVCVSHVPEKHRSHSGLCCTILPLTLHYTIPSRQYFAKINNHVN